MSRRLVIFDLDGTLIDSRDAILNSLRYALSETGFLDLEIDEEAAVQQDLRTTLLRAAEKKSQTIDEDRIIQFVKSYREHHSLEPHKTMRPYEGVEEMLARLREECALAIATTKHSHQAKHVLEKLGLLDYFDFVQGTDPGMKYKPEPDILNSVLTHLGKDPEESLYVGDSDHDMHAAHSARMMAVGAAYGFGSREKLERARPHICLDEPTDLFKVLEIERISSTRAMAFHRRPSARRTRTAWTAAQLAMRRRL